MTITSTIRGSNVVAPRPTKKGKDRRLNSLIKDMREPEIEFMATLGSSDETPNCVKTSHPGWVSPDTGLQLAAAMLCNECPFLGPCMDLAVAAPGVSGVRAGTTEDQRQGWKR